MVTIRNIALGITALSPLALNVMAKKIEVIWSGGGFVGAPGTAGNEQSYGQGITILDEDGNELFNQGTPEGKYPCSRSTNSFIVDSSCWSMTREFLCTNEFDGTPQSCEVLDPNGNSLGKGEGGGGQEFIGIALITDEDCGVSFELEDDECVDQDASWKFTWNS